jgi:hypothetical protein
MDKELIKVGAVVPVYNRERYIGPYLEMMEDFGVTCAITLSDRPWSSQGGDETPKHDRTEAIIDKYFSHMRVLKGVYYHHKDSLNAGIEKLQDCDLVLTTDCDMFITREDWEKLMDFVSQKFNWENFNTYAVEFEKMITEYYYDHNYGKAAIPGGAPPIMAVKPDIRMQNMISVYYGKMVIWDEIGPKWHHMRFCKPNGSGKKRCVEPKNDLHDYSPAPEEITKRLIKWQKRLKNI